MLVAVGYYLAARLGFALTLKPYPISTLWPPNALLAGALLLAPASAWWWLLAAALPAHLLAELQSGVPTAMVLGWYVSNCSEALIAAALVRAFVPEPLRLDTLRNGGIFLAGAALAAPLVSSFLDAALVRMIGWGETGYWDLVDKRVFSNILAQLTIAPLVLAWAALIARRPAASLARLVEAGALFLGLLGVCLLVFDAPLGAAHPSPAVYYAPLPFLLWAAVRLGPAGTTSALALMTVATIWGAVHGLGPFAAHTPQQTARDMQFFLIAVAVPLLLLAVALEERARAERDSREQRRQLTHLSRVAMLAELSGGIAHELNQPLTAILSNAQAAQHFLANKTAEPELLAEILQDIILADQRAGDVIARLRALFKRGEERFETLDANALVREVLALTHGDLTTRGVELVLRLAPRLPDVRGDRVQLQQLLLNLVVNAAEAMSVIPQQDRLLTVQTLATAGRVHINVVDRGPGFKVAAEKLFEAFYTTKPQGLGLGLSISRSIIKAHGGRLWASNRRGGGAAFLITLPSTRSN
ncbi:MAG TPA: MASE1 domain-containing protein [Burkholderiales bacterium]|nr:MASE1 domain-containing protein [Burkholderiales bacterium]